MRRLLRPSEPVVLAPEPCEAGGGMLDESAESDDKLLADAASRRGRFDCPNDVVRMRLPAADCKSVNDVDSLTPADDDPGDCCAFGLRVALWKALEMLHLRRPEPPVAVVGTGSADSPAVLRPLLEVVRLADIGGACRPYRSCAVASGKRCDSVSMRGEPCC